MIGWGWSIRLFAGKPNSSDLMTPTVLDSLIFRFLIRTCSRRDKFWVKPWWEPVYNALIARGRTLRLTFHGREVLVNSGNTYPLIMRSFRSFNAPLLELVHELYKAKERPFRFVDVGSATGDTVLMVESNCPAMVSEYVCVDGDPVFFEYLKHNLSFLPNVRYVHAQLSRSAGYSPSLVRIHAGTASAQGEEAVQTAPLDEVLGSHAVGSVDLLKIDVDGFDGEVLAGAIGILANDRPCVIFEWHPILCKQTGNDWREAFKALISNGYSRFVWFTNFGPFSHFMLHYHEPTIDALAEYCLRDVPKDLHFDVVALHDSSPLDIESLAMLEYSAKRTSPF